MDSTTPKKSTNSESNSRGPHKFTHLHLHTSYSLLDGAIRIPSLMKHVKEQGMDAVAMTDHGNMYGAIEFYKAAVKEGVKPIIGCEFYVAPGKRSEKRNMEGKIQDGGNYHLVVLATNQTGYRNLIKIASRSFTEGFYRKPRIDYDLLAEHNEGLVCLTACLGGEVQQKILREKPDEAARLAGHLREVFGKDRFFLEIQNHGLPEEETVARANLEIARKHDIRIVLTNDSHFLTRSDQEAQDILLRINQKKTIADDLYFSFNNEFYVKNPAEMARLFPEIPEAMHNTQLIGEMCDLNFTFGNPLLPKYDVPHGYNLDSWLRKLAEDGLKRRYNQITPAIMERFEFEYKVITSMDFSGYFLIVQDFINWAKQNNIPVGPGRGSAAGSIIAFTLGITEIDPIRYNLLFERFLNPDRNELPDIDVDFCAEKRETVINYVRNKYGTEKVGQIITYGKMAAKACLKDVARVLNIPFEEANSISKMFPDVLNIGIDDALEASSDLKKYSERGDVQRKLFQVARTLENNTRHTGIHAAGVVIAPQPLEELVPMATVANKDKSKDRVPVAQYDMSALTDVGLVKMDFLGLRNLTIIENALQGIERRTGKRIDLAKLPQDDAAAYQLLHRGDVAGVFQLESSQGMREFVIRMKPERFEDIIALIALFRPGPLQAGMADSFINRKKGKEKVVYPHADLKDVLDDTYGVIVYQEQVMLISRIIGNFTPGQADALRKAMGKKILEKMAEMRVKFIEGACAQKYEKRFAANLYDQMAEFAKYGFNKSHSAAYAYIVYQTAYLKANYPTDYMRAVLDSELDKTEKLVPYINACRSMGITILGPDINESEHRFTYIAENVIRFGLGAVKNVGSQAVESILSERLAQNSKNYDSFFNFIENVDLRHCNKRMLESLIYAGAFNSMGYTRKSLISGLDIAITHGQQSQKDKKSGQDSLFGNLSDAAFQQEPIPRGKNVSELAEGELLTHEKEVLGFYFSGHPLKKYERTLRKIKAIQISELDRRPGGSTIELAGVITDSSIRLTRTNKEMCRLSIEDITGSMEAVMFPAAFEKHRHNVIKDQPMLIQGTLEKKEDTGTPQLIIKSLQILNQEILDEKQEKSLHLMILHNQLGPDTLKQLQAVIRNNRGKGNLQIYFHLQADEAQTPGDVEERKVIRAHDSFRVEYSRELTENLARISQIKAIYLSVGDQLSRVHPDGKTSAVNFQPAAAIP